MTSMKVDTSKIREMCDFAMKDMLSRSEQNRLKIMGLVNRRDECHPIRRNLRRSISNRLDAELHSAHQLQSDIKFVGDIRILAHYGGNERMEISAKDFRRLYYCAEALMLGLDGETPAP